MTHFNVFLVLLVCGTTTVLASSCGSVAFNKYAKPEKCDKDVYLYGSEIDELDVNSKAECTANCNRNDQCQSVSFEEKQTFGCELSSATPSEDGLNMDTRSGYSYYEKDQDVTSSSSKQCSNFQGCRHLKWIEYDVDTLAHRHDTQGAWGKDPLSPNETVYYQTSYSNRKDLYSHPTEQDYRDNTNRVTYTLPVGCDGAQGIAYGSKWWCQEHHQLNIVAFDLPDVNTYRRISFADVEGHNGGIGDQCAWSWGGYSGYDFAADEYGLWVIWGRYDQSCYFALSKINTFNYTIEKNYFFSTNSKRSHGQAFMVCGVLYIVNQYNPNPSWIRFTYNTHNETFTEFPIRGNAIMFPNKHSYNSYTNYYHNQITGERYIAMWDSARQMKLTPVMFDP